MSFLSKNLSHSPTPPLSPLTHSLTHSLTCFVSCVCTNTESFPAGSALKRSAASARPGRSVKGETRISKPGSHLRSEGPQLETVAAFQIVT